jgi:gamma-glutamyltranspeptidase
VEWADLVAPAIEHAEQGFVLDEALPTSIAEGRRFLERYPEARRIFLPEGRVPRPGERLANKDYASTLRAIAAEGADTFYRGRIARAIAADLAAAGGIIEYADLAQYRAIERAPLSGRYRGHTLYTSPPPVSSGATLIETLQILDRYRPPAGASVPTDADYFHYLIEAWKVRDPIRRIADPDRWPVDLGDHLDPEHAAELFGRIDPVKASRFPAGGAAEPPTPPGRIGRGTTGFVVADADGNMIAVTQTLSTWGGNFYVSKGLGFLYNNHLRSNRTTEGAYGQLLPLVRSSTTSNPTLVFRDEPDGRVPRLAVSAAGNAWITASVYGIIAGVIDGGLDAQRAIEAPRFLVSRDPSDPAGTAARIQIEDRVPRAVLDDLGRRGHRFQKIGRKGEVRYGYAALAVVDPAGGVVHGGSEPRRSHMSAGAGGPATNQPRP